MSTKGMVSAAAIAALVVGAVGTWASADGRGKRRFRAQLHGYNEVPAISTTGRGTLKLEVARDGSSIAYELDYRDLEGGDILQAHIHLGDTHTNGGISAFLCTNLAPPMGAPMPPPCVDPGPGPEAEGVITADWVIGPAGQGIAAGELDELIAAIRSRVTYANVHTATFPGGEIRGKIR